MNNCHGVCGLCAFRCTKIHFVKDESKTEKQKSNENLPIVKEDIIAEYEIKPSLKERIFGRK